MCGFLNVVYELILGFNKLRAEYLMHFKELSFVLLLFLYCNKGRDSKRMELIHKFSDCSKVPLFLIEYY